MGRLAVYKFAYFLSILFTIFILGLSIFAYFSGKINPVENMFAAYVALSKPILVVVNTILFIYWLIRLRYWLWIPLTGLIVNYEYITSMYQIYNPTLLYVSCSAVIPNMAETLCTSAKVRL